MTTKHANIIALLLIVAQAVYSALLLKRLPATVPTHWGINMRPDAWGSKWTLPVSVEPMPLVILILLNVVPRLKTKGLSIEPSLPAVNVMMVSTIVFMSMVGMLLLALPLVPRMPFMNLLMTGMLLMFLVIGSQLSKLKRNYWCGVRTRATLASDEVWDATHRFTGKWMMISSVIGIFPMWLGAPAWTGIIPIFVLTPVAMVYANRFGRAQ